MLLEYLSRRGVVINLGLFASTDPHHNKNLGYSCITLLIGHNASLCLCQAIAALEFCLGFESRNRVLLTICDALTENNLLLCTDQ